MQWKKWVLTKVNFLSWSSPILEALVHDNDGEMETDNFSQDGECVENSHDWSGGTIRRIRLKSMVVS